LREEGIVFNHDRSEEPYGVRLYDVNNNMYVIDSKENKYIVYTPFHTKRITEGDIEEVVNYIKQNIISK